MDLRQRRRRKFVVGRRAQKDFPQPEKGRLVGGWVQGGKEGGLGPPCPAGAELLSEALGLGNRGLDGVVKCQPD